MENFVSSFLSSYQSTLAQSVSLPAEISDQYELFDCLHATEEKFTYLVRKKDDETIAVLKIAKKPAKCDLESEYRLLAAVRSVSFPEVVSYLSDERADYLIRSYIAGFPVSRQIEKFGPFDESEAMRLVIGLCDSLHLLHSQTPPVIHRDIKPQNVIFTPEHNLAIIDFDTVRQYQAEKSKDTAFLGTDTTAAPEQYGYKQTDQRSDVYSTGILLLFLCTGSYELDSCSSIRNRRLTRIIKTCTRFDPDRRYPNIRRLQSALVHALKSANRSPKAFLGGSLIGFACGFVLALALHFFGMIPSAADPSFEAAAGDAPAVLSASANAVTEAVTFDSPQIEQAVRAQLGYSPDTPLYPSDLERITQLLIFGGDVLTNWADVSSDSLYHSNFPSGNIFTLSDIPKFTNLTDLAICNQHITDLSPLRGMSIARLALGSNQISDLSALSDLPNLVELYIGNNPIVRIDALQGCEHLYVLDLSNTAVIDLSPLSNQQTKYLYLNAAPVGSYDPLESMGALEKLAVSNINQNDLAVISRLKHLTYLEYRGNLSDISPLFNLVQLTGMMCFDPQLTSLEGIGSLTQLSYFLIDGPPNLDLSPLAALPQLNALDIEQQEYKDYSPLIGLKNLRTLFCSANQKAVIEEMWPEVEFELSVY